MSLATTTDTAAITPAPLSKYEIQRNERHAEAQGRSNAKRKAKNAPRRDDMARIVLFFMLMQYQGSKHDTARTAARYAILKPLIDAGFDETEAEHAFDRMISSVGADLDRYFMLRGIKPAVRNKWRERNGLPLLPDRSAAD